MQKDTKLHTASLLMTMSILLLVLLQAYWLRNDWQDEYRGLKRELAVILRETVTKQQMKEFMRIRADIDNANTDSTLNKPLFNINVQKKQDSSQKRISRIDLLDNSQGPDRFALPGHIMDFERKRHFDELNPPEDSGKLVVGFPVMLSVIDMKEIEKNYAAGLKEAGIELPFVLSKKLLHTSSVKGEISIQNGAAANKQLFMNLQEGIISASFANPLFVLLKKILWELFFALVMIGVTSVAFIFLYRSLRQQQRLSDLKNDFIANMTHELKTPIATVGVAIEALKNFDALHDAEKTKEYLAISGTELQRLNLLVDKVIRLSMLGQHQLALQREKVDLNLLIAEVLNSMKLQFERQGALLNWEVAGSDFITTGDRMHLQSVLYNLLDNALKYTPAHPVISVTLKSGGHQLSVKIADNGKGIAPEHLHKIFDKFYRVPEGNTHNTKGYGLGLSYVSEVIKAHGGSIEVESKEGKGSVFIVNLVKESRDDR